MLSIFLTSKYILASISERITNNCENIALNRPIKIIVYSCQTQYYDVVYGQKKFMNATTYAPYCKYKIIVLNVYT